MQSDIPIPIAESGQATHVNVDVDRQRSNIGQIPAVERVEEAVIVDVGELDESEL